MICLWRFLLVIWRKFPIPIPIKIKIKNLLFTHLSIFQITSAYENWLLSSKYSHSLGAKNGSLISEYTPIDNLESVERKPVKFICFYLPQYHPIPENDLWWGKGFTEWTNVRPALPLFNGHYQPHEPGELGYYSLLDKKNQLRQIELAKKYGIEGFCFYFYWFGGERLLEAPTLNYLSDKNLEFPFCLCWANENWTRRWDGLDSEVLIAQNHSASDDLEFIKYISTYLKDPRYIKVDGKPLLIIYRPSLLPNIKASVKLWRDWCLSNGVGEIFLAYTQSFEIVDPKEYHFDAAIEFPPNNSSAPNITSTVVPATQDFSCTIYDWEFLVERSKKYSDRSYKLFRGVCPSWDNTPRRKEKATIFVNNTPALFKKWVSNAIADTVDFFGKDDERLVFVNAWNEWGEGAHLEPDAKYGYAYLHSIRSAIFDFYSQNEHINSDESEISYPSLSDYSNLAIVIHAYYLDIFREILNDIDHDVKRTAKFYVTCENIKFEDVKKILNDWGCDFYLLGVENRGRDVLPFLKIIPKVLETRFDYLIKIHTKKSPHRVDGDAWRKNLINQLVSKNYVDFTLDIFSSDKRIGIIGPSDSVVPMEFYLGSNYEKIKKLAKSFSLSMEDIRKMSFVAGTMFYARRPMIEHFMKIKLNDMDFEAECGQIDGTMAHALERFFAVIAAKNNFEVISIDNKVNCNFSHALPTKFQKI